MATTGMATGTIITATMSFLSVPSAFRGGGVGAGAPAGTGDIPIMVMVTRTATATTATAIPTVMATATAMEETNTGATTATATATATAVATVNTARPLTPESPSCSADSRTPVIIMARSTASWAHRRVEQSARTNGTTGTQATDRISFA